ncbi:MAG: copper-binding protein [Burkholderiales bacterium]|nr:copper-binding protein [Burkholderiales bacterium]
MNTTFRHCHRYLVALALVVAAPLSTYASAQSTPATATAPGSATVDLSEAEVRKVDIDNRKITLKHGEIKNLDMPPMTMTFNVKDGAFLDKLQIGDRIRFRAEKDKGSYWVIAIERVK